jgi:hypothetical protein
VQAAWYFCPETSIAEIVPSEMFPVKRWSPFAVSAIMCEPRPLVGSVRNKVVDAFYELWRMSV